MKVCGKLSLQINLGRFFYLFRGKTNNLGDINIRVRGKGYFTRKFKDICLK